MFTYEFVTYQNLKAKMKITILCIFEKHLYIVCYFYVYNRVLHLFYNNKALTYKTS